MGRSGSWATNLTGFHEDRAGITERVLALAEARGNPAPYTWLAEPLRATQGPILDLACGSAPTRDVLAGWRWLGVDASAGELAVAAAAAVVRWSVGAPTGCPSATVWSLPLSRGCACRW